MTNNLYKIEFLRMNIMNFKQRSSHINSKKASLDIPIYYTVKMIIGLFGLIVIVIPIIMMFNEPDYNRSVANDLSNSLFEFVEYSNLKYNVNINRCYEPFNLQYLSNPQVFNQEYKNYVIILTRLGVGLITFDDYIKIVNNEANFQDFDDVLLDEIIFDSQINLNTLDLTGNTPRINPQRLEVVFFVPSVALENGLSVAVDGFTGDSKSGYHVLYGVNEGSEFVIKPGPDNVQNLYNFVMRGYNIFVDDENEADSNSRAVDSSINKYDFGFFNIQGNLFGPVISEFDSINPMGNCRSSSTTFDSTPDGSEIDRNTKGFVCTIQLSLQSPNREEIIRNSIYWKGREGYKCGSEFTHSDFNVNNLNFCETLENQAPYIFNYNRNENLEEIKRIFESSCEEFYNQELSNDIGLESITYSTFEESNNFVYKTEFNFFDFFRRIPDETILNYFNNEENQRLIFRKEVASNFCKEEFQNIGNDNYNICDFVVEIYDSNGVRNYAFYVHTLEEEHKGFYTVKSESNFDIRQEEGERYFAIGNRKLEDVSSSLRELSCGFWQRVGGILPRIDGCKTNTFNVVSIEENYFKDVRSLDFEMYLSTSRKANKVRNTLEYDFSTYFSKIDGNLIKEGENNEAIEFNEEEYILNLIYLDVTLGGFENIRRDNSGNIIQIDSLFTVQNFEKDVVYDMFKQTPLTTTPLSYTSESEENEVSFNIPLSFEQVLYSMYNHQTLERNKILNEIRNNDFILTPSSDIRTSSNSLYYVVTKDSKKPVYEVVEEDGQERYVPLTFFNAQRYQEQEELFKTLNFEGNIIFPKFQDNGDLLLEKIPYELSGEEVITIVDESEIIN